MNSLRKPTVISTFSGCGGSSLGYKMAGFDVRLAVEWEKNAVDTYKRNFPGTPVFYGDITDLTAERALELAGLKPGELDLLDGSPPCQGFSTAGKRRKNDTRNRLFEQYVRILRDLRPKAFIMENVSGMVKGRMMSVFREVMNELKSSGYEVSARLMNTKWFAVPQSRERTIFIGVRSDLGVVPSYPAPTSAPVPCGIMLRDCTEKGPAILNEKTLALWKATPKGRGFNFVHPLGHKFNSQKLSPNKPSPTVPKTVRAQFAGHFHWDEPRLLSIQEVKRISSFPDAFEMIGTFEEQWARLGNSVPPLFMSAIASHVKGLLMATPTAALQQPEAKSG